MRLRQSLDMKCNETELFLSMMPQSTWLQPAESKGKTQALQIHPITGKQTKPVLSPVLNWSFTGLPIISAAHLSLILTTLPHDLFYLVQCFIQWVPANFIFLTSFKSILLPLSSHTHAYAIFGLYPWKSLQLFSILHTALQSIIHTVDRSDWMWILL